MYDWNIFRKNMLDGQIIANAKFDNKLLLAVSDIPRENFVPDKFQAIAYSDANLYFEDNSFMIAPFKQLKMIDECHIKPEDIVLNIGGGCGYASALISNLAHMAFCLENDKECEAKINKLMLSMSIFNVVTFAAESDKDIARHAPYDVILINGAINKIPDSLCAMLANKGRIIAVVSSSGGELEKQNGKLVRITRNGERYDSEVIADLQIPEIRNIAGVGKILF